MNNRVNNQIIDAGILSKYVRVEGAMPNLELIRFITRTLEKVEIIRGSVYLVTLLVGYSNEIRFDIVNSSILIELPAETKRQRLNFRKVIAYKIILGHIISRLVFSDEIIRYRGTGRNKHDIMRINESVALVSFDIAAKAFIDDKVLDGEDYIAYTRLLLNTKYIPGRNVRAYRGKDIINALDRVKIMTFVNDCIEQRDDIYRLVARYVRS